MPAATMKNNMLFERYKTIIQELYSEPEQEIIMGSILFDNLESETTQEESPKTSKTHTSERKRKVGSGSRDIRSCFEAMKKKQSKEKKREGKEEKQENHVVLLD